MERSKISKKSGVLSNDQKVVNQRDGHVDNRSSTIAQRKLQEVVDNSPLIQRQAEVANSIVPKKIADVTQLQTPEEEELTQGKFAAQLQKPDEEELMQGKFVTQLAKEDEEELLHGKFVTQLVEEEEEEPLQGKFVTQLAKEDEEELMQGKFKSQPNKTGMPDNLKSGVEKMAGIDMGAVNVHFNSSRPAQLNAHAFTQGNDIHIAPSQQKHLPHEAWHVVQQSQGRVQPTTEVGGKPVNDDTGLEKEADVMGAKATQMKKKQDQ